MLNNFLMKLSSTIFCLFLFNSVFGQIAGSLGVPGIQNYSIEEYKASEQNWYIVKDQRDITYFANTDGILEYDGKNWNLYPVANLSTVRSVCVDSSGIVYAGAYSEFGCLLPDKSGTLKYFSLSDQLDTSIACQSEVWKIYYNNGVVYFCSYNYIYVYQNLKFVEHIKLNSESSLFTFLKDRELYVGDIIHGLLKVVGNGIVTMPGADFYVDKDIMGIEKLNKNEFIICSSENVFIYNLKSGSSEVFFEKDITDILLESGIYCITSNSNSIIIGTLYSGLFIFDKSGQLKYHLTKENGLQDDQVTYVYMSNEALWCAFNNGISKIDLNLPFSLLEEKSGIKGIINDVTIFNGNIIVATSTGVFYSSVKNKNEYEFIKINDINTLTRSLLSFNISDNRTKLLAGTIEGIFDITNLNNIKQIKVGNYPALYTNKLKQSRFYADCFYVGTNSEVISVIFQNENYRIKDEIRIDQDVSNIAELSDKELWVSISSQGLIRVNLSRNENTFQEYSQKNGLPAKEINEAYYFKDKIVITTSKGLYTYDKKNDTIISCTMFESFFKNSKKKIRKLWNFGNDIYWVNFLENSNNKIVAIKFDNQNQLSIDSLAFKLLPEKKIEMAMFSDDTLSIFGIESTLYLYNSKVTTNYYTSFAPLIRKIVLSKDSVIFGGTFSSKLEYNSNGQIQNFTGYSIQQSDIKDYIISNNYNDVTFYVSAPYFIKEEKIEFSYLLEGDDEQWSHWTYENKYIKTNLKSGTYTFKVRARNIFGVESDISNFNFRVLPPWYNTIYAIMGYIVCLVLLIWVIVKINSRRLIKEKEHLEQIVTERTAEIRNQKEEIEQQRDEIVKQRDEIKTQHDTVKLQRDQIAQQKKDIEDSIYYAQRIQNAVMPSIGHLGSFFEDHFLLFRPRDIVSGDFFWGRKIGNKVIITVADCTGHGVPGAFMSMLGITLLNEITTTHPNLQANEILNKLREEIKSALKQKGSDSEPKDGMDMALCIFDFSKSEMQYTGAYNPLIIIQNSTLTEIPADRMPVGVHLTDYKEFANNIIPFHTEDVFYLFSDGFVDQIGGPKTKKLMRKKLKSILLKIYQLPMELQLEKLNEELNKWQGTLPQIDDVTIVGLRV